MADVSRRMFLRGALAVGATSLIIRPTALLIPSIVGDGIHDDGPGLNALFAQQPVDVRGDMVRIIRGDNILIARGHFRTTQPLNVSGCTNLELSDNFFMFDGEFGDGYLLLGNDVRFAKIIRNNFQRTTPNPLWASYPPQGVFTG